MDASPSAPAAVEAVGLSKSYRIGWLGRQRRPALRELSLRVEPGEVFGYLGPNGSGKTTTLKILMGLVFPDAGSASVLGRPLGDRSFRERVGFLPEHPYLYDYLTPREYLDYAGRLFGLPKRERQERARVLLERVGLARASELPMRRFSKGMVQRAALAQALVNDPELVILDEPMSGLDPLGRRHVRNLILELKARGKTVLFSTHILSDAESLCDRVAVLRGGRLLGAGRIDAILDIDVSHYEMTVSGLAENTLARLPEGALARHTLGERSQLEIAGDRVGEIATAVERAGGRVLGVHPVRQTLEDYFFKQLDLGGDLGEWDTVD